MPRYSKSQLDGFVADRRYWDQKHPEHQAHLDFTVKAFEETYPDPLMPTKEQEEWAAAEEKRLRELGKRRPFWDSRDPGHADARAEFYRGFDKINAVLYGTPASDGDAPAASKTGARDPLDPVMPASDGFARAARATQMSQAAQAPGAQFRSPAQIHRNETIGDRPAPSAGNPNRTVWQAESDDAARAAEAARQRAIQQERSLPESQRRLTNRAPEDWDRERPMPPMTNPIPGAPIRARDPQGEGHFGARRMRSTGPDGHRGVDIEAAPGARVVSPVDGVVYEPPGQRDDGSGRRAIVIRTEDGHEFRLLYLSRDVAIRDGARVIAGQTALGTAVDNRTLYPGAQGLTNHIHMEVHKNGRARNPRPSMRRN